MWRVQALYTPQNAPELHFDCNRQEGVGQARWAVYSGVPIRNLEGVTGRSCSLARRSSGRDLLFTFTFFRQLT